MAAPDKRDRFARAAERVPRGLPLWCWVLLLAVLVVPLLVAEWRDLLNGDVSWFLYCAGRLLHGERMYTDILEINPPLIVWLNVPVYALAQTLDLPPGQVFRVVTTLLLAGSGLATAWLLEKSLGGVRGRPFQITLTAVVFALFPLMSGAYGQREHLAFALLLPWLALVAVRRSGTPVPGWAAAGLGLAGAVGLALKPPYLLALPLVLGFRSTAGGRWKSRLWPEDAALAAGGALYCLALWLWVPEYAELARRFGAAYLSFGEQRLGHLLLLETAALGFYTVLVAWRLSPGAKATGDLAGTFVLAAAGLFAAVLLQHKGWNYHFLPMRGCVVVAAGAVLAGSGGAGRGAARMIGRTLAAGLLVVQAIFAAVLIPGRLRHGPLDFQLELHRAVEREAGARSLLALSSDPGDAFPLALDEGLEFRASFHHLWIQVISYASPMGPGTETRMRSPDAMGPLERFAFDRVVADMRRLCPDLLVVESPRVNFNRMRFPGGFDYLAYFSQDPRFTADLRRYRRVADVQGVWVFRREVPCSR